MEKLIRRIKSNEGFRNHLYLDSEGFLSGGYGHHFYVGSRLPADAAEILFKMDITAAISEFMKISPVLRKKLNPARKRVVVEMIFNMNLQKVLSFKKFWTAVELEDWHECKVQMLDSKWHQQVKGRAERLADIFEKGEDGDEEKDFDSGNFTGNG